MRGARREGRPARGDAGSTRVVSAKAVGRIEEGKVITGSVPFHRARSTTHCIAARRLAQCDALVCSLVSQFQRILQSLADLLERFTVNGPDGAPQFMVLNRLQTLHVRVTLLRQKGSGG